MGDHENRGKRRLIIAAVIMFVLIFVYEALTPMLSDDLNYGIQVRAASSVADLFRQEAVQYMGWSGRSVAHILLRCFLYGGSKGVFNVCAAVVFTLMTLGMYRLANGARESDVKLYLLLSLMVWMCGISFAETVLWETGACNYLFTTAIVLGFLSAVRRVIESGSSTGSGTASSAGAGTAAAAGMFVLGVLAGWCNENTSGGMILIVLLWMWKERRRDRGIPVAVWAGLIGAVIGFAVMLLAPGNRLRALNKEEAHTGLMKYAARFLKVTKVLQEEYLVLICVFAVLMILIGMVLKNREALLDAGIWGIAFLATSYALVAAPDPQERAFFGAGVFLMIGIGRGVAAVTEAGSVVTEPVEVSAGPIIPGAGASTGSATAASVEATAASVASFALTAVVTVMAIVFGFTYIDCGANLARIHREMNERYAVIREAGENGGHTVYLPLLHTEFDNKYTMAYKSELSTDWNYWVNYAYVEYFGVEQVIGVEREPGE